jgi:hypothetical protein
MMEILLLVLGALIGVVVGAAICIRYIKEEMTGRVGPTMELLRLQLDNVQGAVNLALANWHAELHKHEPRQYLGQVEDSGKTGKYDHNDV